MGRPIGSTKKMIQLRAGIEDATFRTIRLCDAILTELYAVRVCTELDQERGRRVQAGVNEIRVTQRRLNGLTTETMDGQNLTPFFGEMGRAA